MIERRISCEIKLSEQELIDEFYYRNPWNQRVFFNEVARNFLESNTERSSSSYHIAAEPSLTDQAKGWILALADAIRSKA